MISFAITNDKHIKKAGQWAETFVVPPRQAFEHVGNNGTLSRVAAAMLPLLAAPTNAVPFPAARGVQGGILLHGPPGCGKTLMAEAAAGTLGVPFLMVQPAHIKGRYFGEANCNLAELFEGGKQAAAKSGRGAVIFFDEADAYGKRTGDPDMIAYTSMLADLLKLIDELASSREHSRLCVVLATNHREALDPALQSRCSFHLEVPLPSRSDRQAYLTRQFESARAAGFKVPYESALEHILDATEGASIRALAQVLDRANHAWSKNALPDAARFDDLVRELTELGRGSEAPVQLDPEGYA